MKTTLPLLLITFASAKAVAFQVKIEHSPLIIKPQTSQYVTNTPPLKLSSLVLVPHTWSAIPVAGCQCAFCSQMRAISG